MDIGVVWAGACGGAGVTDTEAPEYHWAMNNTNNRRINPLIFTNMLLSLIAGCLVWNILAPSVEPRVQAAVDDSEKSFAQGSEDQQRSLDEMVVKRLVIVDQDGEPVGEFSANDEGDGVYCNQRIRSEGFQILNVHGKSVVEIAAGAPESSGMNNGGLINLRHNNDKSWIAMGSFGVEGTYLSLGDSKTGQRVGGLLASRGCIELDGQCPPRPVVDEPKVESSSGGYLQMYMNQLTFPDRNLESTLDSKQKESQLSRLQGIANMPVSERDQLLEETTVAVLSKLRDDPNVKKPISTAGAKSEYLGMARKYRSLAKDKGLPREMMDAMKKQWRILLNDLCEGSPFLNVD